MGTIDMKRIAAVVVWYNPAEKEVEALKLYAGELACVLVVDNSEADHAALLDGLELTEYISLGKNMGIATALNVGCRRAVESGAEWVLTMDQDSLWKLNSVSDYVAEVNQYPQLDDVAVFSPLHVCHDGFQRPHEQRFEARTKLMCSGNLLRLEAWRHAGGFREDFFIDYVDFEICFHLCKQGWKLIRANRVRMLHPLGDAVVYAGCKRRGYVMHPAWRYFYMGRNCRWMMHLYPRRTFSLARDFVRELRHVCLYDTSRDKREKLRNYFKGWSAGKHYNG